MIEVFNETKSVEELIFDSLFKWLGEDDSFDDSTIENIRSLYEQHTLTNKSLIEKALKPGEVENEDNWAWNQEHSRN